MKVMYGQIQRDNEIPRVVQRRDNAQQAYEDAYNKHHADKTTANWKAENAAFAEMVQAEDAASNLGRNYIEPPNVLFSVKYDDYLNYHASEWHQPPPNPKTRYLSGLAFMSKAYKASIYNASALPPGSRMPPLTGERLAQFNKVSADATESTREQVMMSARALSASGLAMPVFVQEEHKRPTYMEPAP